VVGSSRSGVTTRDGDIETVAVIKRSEKRETVVVVVDENNNW
jgi:hypothetical protein